MIAEKLKLGDTIGFFSPSTPITSMCPKRYNRAKNFIKSKGFNLIEGNLTEKKDFYRSGSILERANEFNELIYNPDVKCIISTIGGMNTNSILPYIDYEAIKNNPKIIIGYSDMTALLLAIYSKTGLTTYYGPALVASFGELSPLVDETFLYFANILNDNSSFPQLLPTPKRWTDEYIDWEVQNREKVLYNNNLIGINPSVITGRLIGGNLNTMTGFWGSEFMPEIKHGDILLIEDSLKDISLVERLFSLLKVNGIFEKVSAIILGKHEQFNDLGTNRRPLDVLLEVLGDKKLPILAEFDCCHTHPMLTMPIGALVEVNTMDKTVKILSESIL